MIELVALAEVEECLHALPVRIAGMVSLDVRVDATSAPATAQVQSNNAVDLHEVDLGFLPPPLSSPRRIVPLVADFGTVDDTIVATVDVEHILHSALDEE